MSYRQEKFVQFQDWKSEKSSDGLVSTNEGIQSSNFGLSMNAVSRKFRLGFERGSERIVNLQRSFKSHSFSSLLAKGVGSSKTILDPQGPLLQKWNKIFVISCIIALSLDPLFFYIPVINDVKKCLMLDKKLETTACVLRSFTDIFYIVHIIFQFRTGFIAPSSRVFGRGVLVEDASAIAKRYVLSYFLIDILAVLPLPQVAVVIIIPHMRGSDPLHTKNLLKYIVLFQYIPRVLRVFPLYKEVTRTSGILTETAWAGAAFNLFLYMLASHVLGAFWYLSSIERETTCWREACQNSKDCIRSSFHCDDKKNFDLLLNASCPIKTPNTTIFDFGIYHDALNSGIVESKDFPQKLFYCFWWGLQNLSSLGQNLKTSTYVWEICFAVFISISGLVLFSFLIGNMQTYLQSTTKRLEEMRVKRRDAEQWMSHRLLPANLRERIRRYEQYKWQETRGVDEENLIRNLPKDLRRDIKRHLCLALLTRVPMFEKMDEQLLDALCDCLKPVLHTEDSYIVREGDPVDEMLFVMRGKLLTVTTNGGRTGFFNSDCLKAGDFCGEELLTWALDPHSSSNLPISTRTVRVLSEVEAFALMADDLKFVASQYRRLHSKQLRHTFRFYSQQWKTWAACFIQAAWRRHCRKKMEESLREEEDRLQTALAKGAGSSPSLGATIYASRFAANALRALRRNSTRKARIPDRVPPMLLQKPRSSSGSLSVEVKELEELPEQWRRSKLAWLCKELPAHKQGVLVRVLNAQRKWVRQEDATYLAVHCLRIRENETAFRVYKWMRQQHWFQFDFALATKLADYMGKERKHLKCQDIFDDIIQQGLVPAESTFHILTVAYLSSSSQGCLEQACTTYNRMIQLGGYKPRLSLHNSLFRALVSNPGDSAKHNLKQAEFVYHNLSTSGLEIHEDIYRGLIWLLSHQDVVDKERIASLRLEMNGAGFGESKDVLVSILRACSKEGDVVEAESTWTKLLSFGNRPPSLAFVYRMEVYARVGEPMKSWEIFRSMQELFGSATVSAFHKVIEVLCNAQEMELAESVMTEFINSGMKPLMPSYIDLLNLYYSLGLHDKLEATFSQCLENCDPNRSMFNIYLKSLVQIGNLEKAEEIFNQMYRNEAVGINTRSCNLILRGYLSSGDNIKAEKIYNLMCKKKYNIEPPLMEKLDFVLSLSRKVVTKPTILKLSSNQREILVGLLLGGLQIVSDESRKNHAIQFHFREDSATHNVLKRHLHYEYHEWLASFCKAEDGADDYIPCQFTTISHSYFSFYADQFWPSGRPAIPKLINRWLSPRALAYWYMYGGYRTSSGDILLRLKGSQEGVAKVVQALKMKSLDCRVKKKGKAFWIGLLGSNSTWFWKLVEPFILDDLKDILRAGEQSTSEMGETREINFDSGSDFDSDDYQNLQGDR